MPGQAIIVGAGAQGRVVLDILRVAATHSAILFADEDPRLAHTAINGAEVIGSLDHAIARHPSAEMIVALGNPDRRIAIASRIATAGIPLLNAIHPSAVIQPSATLGAGIMIGANAVINTGARIGNNVIVNTAAVVEHDCCLQVAAMVGPGAHLGGRVTLGPAAFVSTAAVVLSRLTIGARTVVAAGAVVTRDLPPSVIAFGVPAKVRAKLDEKFDWSRVL
jgi:sugar O-acyltransferase (sialic acid O-acetyltransferase NeuD family)